MALPLIRKAFEHLWWADERVGQALVRWQDQGIARATVDARTHFDTAVEVFGHVLGAEMIWLDRIEGLAQSVAVWPDGDLKRCLEFKQSTKLRYADYLDGLITEDLSRRVKYVNSAGDSFETAVEDILLHVALHGVYHRGQIARFFREGGGEPAPTDYIGFVRGAPAATRN